ncbi:MAG TPA: proline--tRNA ligase [Fibrobacteraceae bacterium]|nr:proline--tRNA ligase [Fibrobacteraceae bacterium]
MKVSQFFFTTLREAPSDATLPSHVFLMRGGFIKPTSTGVYSILPLGLRVLRKIEDVIRMEMSSLGGLEVDLPLVQTSELWSESGRYQAIGEELLRFKDRTGHPMVLAMTHEEAMTDLVRYVLNSYRQLPFMLYQFKLKYRDEARARGGLIRVREFVMKDAYSFHSTQADLDAYYQRVYDAYVRIFHAVGIEPVVVQSDTGIMGGKIAHEFMLDTPNGEDYLILCKKCGLQANREIAKFARKPHLGSDAVLEKVATPTQQSIEEVSSFLQVFPEATAKCVFLDMDGKLVTAMVPGNLEVSEVKLRNLLKAKVLVPADEALIRKCGMVPGFASPIGCKDTRVIVDEGLATAKDVVVGANEEGFHFRHCVPARDFAPGYEVADIAQADNGCTCPNCGAELTSTRGIELGNIFKLGIKFSESMNCKFLDESSKQQPAIMGCYGIGVGRLMASIIEAHHDDWGPIWPKSVAPFQALVVSLSKDAVVTQAAEKLYNDLVASGVDALYDDRPERPGVKFKDADLWGIPLRIGVGAKGLAESKVEWKLRSQKDFELVSLADVVEKTLAWITE